MDKPAKKRTYANAAEWIASPEFQREAVEAAAKHEEKRLEHRRQLASERDQRKKAGLPTRRQEMQAEREARETPAEKARREKQRQLARANYERKKNGEPPRPMGRPKGQSRQLPVRVVAEGSRDGEATLHARQKFDPIVNRKNPRWAMYRPFWLRESEKIVRIYPSSFRQLRESTLYMTQEQCAAFLRVDVADVMKWETGSEAIPFAAFIALRLAHDLEFLPHQVQQWSGWEIIDGGQHIGMLYNRVAGEMFQPSDLLTWRYVRADAERLNRENIALKKRVAEMQAENTALRELYLSNGITKELHSMQGRIAALLSNINTAEVIEFDRANEGAQLKEKAA